MLLLPCLRCAPLLHCAPSVGFTDFEALNHQPVLPGVRISLVSHHVWRMSILFAGMHVDLPDLPTQDQCEPAKYGGAFCLGKDTLWADQHFCVTAKHK